ncbi:MAG: outer membrane protein assembly factor BamE [Gammaproteobacteria bacterium]|nr:outer membrane protein assembly factor BamE [Gammaproteobacteria bacterium]
MPRRIFPAIAATAIIALAGCVYVPPVTQGNYLSYEDLQQLKVGMTPTQVVYLFGKPMLDDPFYPDTWHYVYYYKRGAGAKEYLYRLTVQFEDGKVASFDTSEPLAEAPGAPRPGSKTPATPAPPPATS